MQLGCHPVAVVQYTFTHKQYRERHKTNNTENNTTIWESAGRAPSWLVIPWPFNSYLGYVSEGKGMRRATSGLLKWPKTISLHTDVRQPFIISLSFRRTSTDENHDIHPSLLAGVSFQHPRRKAKIWQ